MDEQVKKLLFLPFRKYTVGDYQIVLYRSSTFLVFMAEGKAGVECGNFPQS